MKTNWQMDETLEFSQYALPLEGFAIGSTQESEKIRWPAEWLQRKIEDVESLVERQANWDSYGAYPADPLSVWRATSRLPQIAQITTIEPDVGLTPSGTVTLSWRWDQSRTIEIEFLPDGRLGFAYVDMDREENDLEGETLLLGDIANH